MLLDFFNTVVNLKTIPRQGWIDKLGLEKPESVSDHTFSMAMMAMFFSDMQRLDTLKVLKMCLIHDLAESRTGDLTPDQISKTEKRKLEMRAMEEILLDLPENFRKKISEIWTELLEKETPESILVHEIDKLEMALQAKQYEKTANVNVSSFLKTAEDEIKNPQLKELFTKIVDQKHV